MAFIQQQFYCIRVTDKHLDNLTEDASHKMSNIKISNLKKQYICLNRVYLQQRIIHWSAISIIMITSKTDKNIVPNSTAVCIELFKVGIISVTCSGLHCVQVQVMVDKPVKTEFRATKPVQCCGLQYTIHSIEH